MDTIFLVSSGEYSDYSIHAAFSSREKAAEYISKLSLGRPDGYEIEEFALNPEVPVPPKDRELYRVLIARDGEVWSCTRYPSLYIEELGNVTVVEMEQPIIGGCHTVGFWEREEYGKPRRKAICLDLYCFAKDESHAAKIASERRSQFLAAGIWPKDFGEWLDIRYREDVVAMTGETPPPGRAN